MKQPKPLTAAQFARRYAEANADLRASLAAAPRSAPPVLSLVSDRHGERTAKSQTYRQQGGE